MRSTIAALIVAAALAAAGTACSGSSSGPTADSGSGSSSGSSGSGGTGAAGTCRTYPTAATVSSTTSGVTQNLTLTGSFSSANQSTVATVFANGTACTTTVNSYGSAADFVDEVKVIPPLPRQTGTVTTNGPGCGNNTSSVAYVYDTLRRLVSFTSTAVVGGFTTSGTTSYTAWDGSGRATSGGFPGATISNVYDDVARTLTQTQVSGGSTTVNTTTFDVNGTNTQVVSRTGNITSTTTFTVTATARVCK